MTKADVGRKFCNRAALALLAEAVASIAN